MFLDAVQVRATLAHKERVKEELVEKERVIMVLERKMELEKEMQAAYVQKDDGSDVVAGMKREIHRMQLRCCGWVCVVEGGRKGGREWGRGRGREGKRKRRRRSSAQSTWQRWSIREA